MTSILSPKVPGAALGTRMHELHKEKFDEVIGGRDSSWL